VGGVLPEQRAFQASVVNVADQVERPAIQGLGDLHKPGKTDPVKAALVLLDLLEGEADGIGKRRLGQADSLSALSDAEAKRNVKLVRRMAVSGRSLVHIARLATRWGKCLLLSVGGYGLLSWLTPPSAKASGRKLRV
jgi:hypothetical protein